MIRNTIASFLRILRQIRYILTRNQKRKSIFLFFNMIVASLLDMLGVAAVLPFINSLTDPEAVASRWYTRLLMRALHLDNDLQMMLALGACIILIYIVKNIYLWLYNRMLIRYQCGITQDISIRMLRSYMARPYSFFRRTNSSILIRGINDDAIAVYYILNNLFMLCSQLLTTVMIAAFLIRQDVGMTMGLVSAGAICILVMAVFVKRSTVKAGRDFMESNAERMAATYQTINGIKEIMVMRRQTYFTEKYERAYGKYTRSLIKKNQINIIPIRIIEAVFVSFVIGTVCIKLLLGMNPIDYVPQLSLFAVAGFRLIPLVTAVPSCMNELAFYKPMLGETYENIKEARTFEVHNNTAEKEDGASGVTVRDQVPFDDSIDISSLSFRYEDGSSNVLNKVSLQIHKGESVGIIGESGSGKSTLADLLMGLQRPSAGDILVDGTSIYQIPERWCRMIGYIPQSVYMLDDTIRSNVTFGIADSEVSDERVWNALDRAHISDFIRTLPDGLETKIGERGVRLSGGQCQRIAIARALYYDPEILILDEATSALDNETEAAVMESIDELQKSKTLIIIAHRLSTIRNCDSVYLIENGTALRQR